MKNYFRMNRNYDVERLVADLRTAEQYGKAHLHWKTEDHDGGWSAIPLVSVYGSTEPEALQLGKGPYEKTPILKACPYVEEIVDSFQCPKHRIRFMTLEAGKNIHEHRDPGDSWALNQVRLHVPIITHDEVYFYLAGDRVIMKPGEMWYLDFSKPHWVHNKSPITRIHLVFDLVVNDWLRSLFPPETFVERLDNWKYWSQYHGTETARSVAHALGLNKVKHLLKGKARTLSKM
jgi:hypothetical protein